MIQIDDLVLRVPGYSPDEARELGEEVAKQVAANLPDGMKAGKIPAIDIKLQATQHKGKDELAKAIAKQIVEKIKWATL
jgi:hypothetical protein